MCWEKAVRECSLFLSCLLPSDTPYKRILVLLHLINTKTETYYHGTCQRISIQENI
jgi:hypothetical protein